MIGKRHLLAAALILLSAPATFAQTTATTTTAATTATTASGPTVTEERDSRETREEFRRLLGRYPPEVGRVLKLDPTLLTNESYLSNYPVLKKFIAENPEVVHAPRYYLESVWMPTDAPDRSASERVWNQVMEGTMILVVLILANGMIVWLIKTIVVHRRWGRLSKVQAEVHNKLLDRFASNEELMAYIQTPAGRRFLESAPIALDAEPQPVSAPVGRILWSIQVGLVLAAAGAGLFFATNTVDQTVGAPMLVLSILAISIGIGFVLSAVVSYAVSRRLGLWEPQAPAADQAGVR